ncbi:hypothetical protein LJR219_002619 [Phenylobacterium sp. LjRoot219]|uniref:hypothetical protein n=1 Tax=Phenylobacterium sp. LjRoot219 TaxID=3342283 RepID=UPI003ECD957F
MTETDALGREVERRIDDCSAHAAALVERLGAEGVDWLDSFLADYVFRGEPLDRVLLRAREMSRLPPRSWPQEPDDD